MSSKADAHKDQKIKFNSLIRELGEAKIHFLIYRRLCDALKGKTFHTAWDFWNYTITAHAHSALIHLCRVYDDHPWGVKEKSHDNPFHLLRYVKEVEQSCHGLESKAELR